MKLYEYEDKFKLYRIKQGHNTPAQTTLKNYKFFLKKLDLNQKDSDLFKQMIINIDNYNKNPHLMIKSYKSYINIMFKYPDQYTLPNIKMPKRNEERIQKQMIPRKLQIHFIKNLPKEDIVFTTLIKTLFVSSRRFHDIINTRINDIITEEDYKGILIRKGKGSKVDVAYIDEDTYKLINILINKIKRNSKRKIKNNPFIFVKDKYISYDYNKMDQNAEIIIKDKNQVYKSILRKLKKCSNDIIGIELSIHIIRHWNGTYYFNKIGQLKTKIMLGHKSIASTQQYAHEEDRKNVYREINNLKN